jgi:protein-disulfide isomerase
MRCEEAENDIAEYLAGTLPTESALLDHLASCSRCRNEVQELKKTWTALESVTVPSMEPAMKADLLAALAQAKLDATPPITPVRRKPMPYLVKPILWIVMSAGAALFMSHYFERPVQQSAVGVESTVSNTAEAHYRGAANPELTLVEYGDYACPACIYTSIVHEVLQRYGNRVRLEFRHYPLTTIHPNALRAAVAAEAAGRQGRFWEMHDLLFSTQQKWSRVADPEAEFLALAAALGLDANRFRQALQQQELTERVMSDVSTGRKANVEAVPTFFLNGRRIEHAPTTVDGFLTLIEAQLASGSK